MLKFVFKLLIFFILFIVNHASLHAQNSRKLSTIPRVDIHAHIGSTELMADYMGVRKVLKEQFNIDLAMWVDLGFPVIPMSEIFNRREYPCSPLKSGGKGIEFLKEVEEKFNGRFLVSLTDYNILDGLRFSPEELPEWMERSVVGYKIWIGVSSAVDHPANDPTFTKMEQIGMIGASIHVAQPYPTSWCEDPIKFWEAQNAWERVLARHPNLKVVMAHMLDLFYSDEQLDYLRYILETYPNLYLDLSARFQQFHRMDRENLRKFMIKYSDRILFGTDIIFEPRDSEYQHVAERYNRCFQILETDKIIQGGFFGKTDIQGLALPIDALEKIYYKNAVKLYPRVKDNLTNLGYFVE
ncbi:amidohydrolase family protein [candidate division KSB1 bacterium]